MSSEELTREVKKERQDTLIALQQRCVAAEAWQCCINCAMWDRQKKLCRVYNVMPPPEVIAVGCREWISDSDIPF